MKSLSERFWEKVDKSGDCWNWTASKKSGGYGQINIAGINTGAHRLSWKLHNGRIPRGMFVCHHCDNSGCVRPSHLFLGTHQDNMNDMHEKGRSGKANIRGADIGTCKLSEGAVNQIRKLYSAGGCKQKWLAMVYKVNQTQISRIIRGTSWRYTN